MFQVRYRKMRSNVVVLIISILIYCVLGSFMYLHSVLESVRWLGFICMLCFIILGECIVIDWLLLILYLLGHPIVYGFYWRSNGWLVMLRCIIICWDCWLGIVCILCSMFIIDWVCVGSKIRNFLILLNLCTYLILFSINLVSPLFNEHNRARAEVG
jgi:hypothetical protein